MPRLDKVAKRRGDLENLSMLMNIAQQFDPRHQVADDIQKEQLAQLRFGGQQQQVMAPFAPREAEMRLGSMQRQEQQAEQMDPIALALAQTNLAGAQEGLDFTRQMQPLQLDRETALGRVATTQADLGEAMAPYQIKGAKLGVREQQLRNTGYNLQNQTGQMSLDQQQELFPITLLQEKLRNFGAAANAGIMIPGLDLQAMTRQYQLPPFPIQGGAPPTSPAQHVNADIAALGMPALNRPEAYDWLQENVPPLAQGFQTNPYMPINPMAKALAYIYSNPQSFGLVGNGPAMARGIQQWMIDKALGILDGTIPPDQPF